jgi:hypothetical protein
MNTAKCIRATQIMNNVKSGHYISMKKFAEYGSVIEDSLLAQQKEADRRLREMQLAREIKLAKV